jgi:hypothetical protein
MIYLKLAGMCLDAHLPQLINVQRSGVVIDGVTETVCPFYLP